MIRKCYLAAILLAFFCLMGTFVIGCSSDSSGSGSGSGSNTQTPKPAAIRVTANPDSISLGQSTTIKAVAYNSSGNTMSGVSLIFTLDNPQVATITSTATTGSDGAATVTFTARDLSGTVNVTAAAGEVKNDPPLPISIISTTAPVQMRLTVNPTSLLIEGTATVKAELFDAAGGHVPNGTSVSFSSQNELFGKFITSSTSTTNNGFASSTFEAGAQPGTAIVTVRSGNLTQQIEITILPALVASIQFISAEPQRIALQGSGGVETSIVKFVVKDSNSDPVPGASVSFIMTGPNGGEYIDPPPDPTPANIEVSTDAEGIAQVILHSGLVAGPVNIVGTIFVRKSDGSMFPISAQSTVISIGGGVASANRFAVAGNPLNIMGLHCQNIKTTITAYLADRFGNYNILKGTTVSYISEAGLSIDTNNVTLVENGIASADARSQVPALSKGPEDVLPISWENELRNYLSQKYIVQINHPRDGLCSVLIYTRGEEGFRDTNANGVYDLSETFTDTENDPFVDANDSLTYDGRSSVDPEEQYIDASSNGSWNGKNNVWDSEKLIFTNLPILITGPPTLKWSNDSGFDIPQGGSATLRLIVCDENGNPPPAGTKLVVSTDNGNLFGFTSKEYFDSSAVGGSLGGQLNLIEYVYTLADKDPVDTEPRKLTTVKATLTYSDPCGGSVTITREVSGYID